MAEDLEAYLAGLSARPVEPEGHMPLTLDQNHLYVAFNDWLRGLAVRPCQTQKDSDARRARADVRAGLADQRTAEATYSGERGTATREKERDDRRRGNTQTRE